MARPDSTTGVLTRAGQFMVYLLFRAVETVLALLPVACCAWIGRMLGAAAYWILPGHRKLALRNLALAFGREKDKGWRRRVAHAHFKSLGGNLLCSLKLPLMTWEQIAGRVTCEGRELAEAVVRSGRSLIYGIPHMGCWELLSQVYSLISFDREPASIYQPLANPWLDSHVKRRRERLGYKLFDRNQGFAGPMKHLREDRGALGVLVDQHAGDKGLWCPFFDRLASTTSLPALMALRCDAALLPLAVLDDGLGRWRLVWGPPVASPEVKQSVECVTAMLNTGIEALIRRAPENWFWVHNRWKTPRPGFLLSKARRGISLPVGYDPQSLQPFQVLVRSPNWLGDACMALPAVRAIKKGRPDLRITVLAPAKLGELWKLIPEVDAVILKEAGERTGSVARKIRNAAVFDAAVLFANSARSAIEVWRAGVPRIVGYRGSLRSWLVDQIVPEPRPGRPPLHHALRYLRIAEHCGGKTDDPSLFATPAHPGAAAKEFALCAGAEFGPAKRWPLERFAGVASLLKERHPEIGWVLVGAPGDEDLGAKLGGLMAGCRHENLVGRTSITELIARLRACRMLLTNDTGTMHLAAALGVPTVSIFGSTEPVLTAPLGANHRVVRHHVPCSPCFARECPFGHYECMKGVSVQRVAAEVLSTLGR